MDHKIKNKELLIAEIDTPSIEIEKMSIFGSDSLEINYLPVFRKSLEKALIKLSTFSNVTTKKIKNREILTRYNRPLPNGQEITLLLPQPEKLIYTENDEIMDYVLLISKIEISSGWIEEPFGPFITGYLQTLHYVIWDNLNCKPVCYGISSSEISFNFQNANAMDFFIFKNARFIIENSPFKK